MKIGIFGGTFDPPHIGHQILAGEALEQLNLDQIYWVLTPYPPHKKVDGITSQFHRIKMVELAIEGNYSFVLSRVDIDRAPPHYAVDTVKLLREQCPEDEFFYLMGQDSLNDLPTWHNPVEFVSCCHGIGVMIRHGEETDMSFISKEIPGLDEKLSVLKTSIIEISSTDIRNRIKNGNQFRYLVPEMVFRYILENNLYSIM